MLKNKFVVCFVITFLGYLSLSFLGLENKSVRLVCTLMVFTIAFLCKRGIVAYTADDKILKDLMIFFFWSVPSILFCKEFFQCGFKLLELFTMVLITSLGVIYFHVKKNLNIFVFICGYYAFQTIITILGYFFDPNALAADNDYGTYVPFLHCNYPPIHGNSIGEFGGVTAMFALVSYHAMSQNKKVKATQKFYLAILFITGLAVLYLSSSRSCMIAALFGLVFLIFRLYKTSTKIKIIVIAIALFALNHQTVINTATSILMKKQNEETLLNSDNEANALVSGRFGIWEKALESPHRLILGNGYGVGVAENDLGASNAHNSMVEILFDCGVFALFFWLRLWWLMYHRYSWLCKMSEFLPVNVAWLHLAAAFAIIAIIRSFGNVSFVYMQLNAFHVVAAIALFSYCRKYVLYEIKSKIKNDNG